jgi:uroporphyrinogen decarboxylase
MPDQKPFLKTLRGEVLATPPVWLMRQAGRYLPEYRATRAQAGDFKTMVYTPDYATEVTLQPLRRFNFDAAILFSDILTIPEALGRMVTFGKDHGPQLEPLTKLSDLRENLSHLDPVYAAVTSIRSALLREGFEQTTLIGFAGAPWTVACYIVEGQGSKEFPLTRAMAYGRAEEFQALIDLLVDVTCVYLGRQIEAGAEVVQLFDSWAGLLPEDQFARWVIEPTRKIVAFLNTRYPHIPVIGFPRQAGTFYGRYVRETNVSAVGLDTQVSPSWAAAELQGLCPVQGNLDPFVLMAGGTPLDEAVDRITSTFAGRPYIFNLGHGIHKDTPPEHVAQLVKRIRA